MHYNASDSPNELSIENLQGRFNEIVLQTRRHMKKIDIDVEEFTAGIFALTVENKQHHREFLEKIKNDIDTDKTVGKIWATLSLYWNFLNYSLLEILIHHFGDDDLKIKMKEYVRQLKKFRSKTRVLDFAKFCIKINEDLTEHDLKDFVISLGESWDECTLEDLETLKENITQKFLLPSFAMNIKDIKPGSIIVTWTLPTLIASALRENLKNMDINEFCKENEIEHILIDSKECKYSPKEKYSDYLKDLYSKMEGENLAVFKLARIEKENFNNKGEADEFTKSTWRGDEDDVIYKKYPMTEDRVCCPPNDSKPPRLILIEGAPGVGKTTFSKQFCHKWSQGQYLKDHTLLVLLQLRNNRMKLANNVSDLFFHPHLKQAIAQEVESTQGEGVALLLEGWDELEEEMREEGWDELEEEKKHSIFVDLVCGRALPKATIIVTSRPWASKTIVESSHIEVDQHIELLTTPKIQYDRVMSEDKVKAEDREEFEDYISSNPAVKAAMHTPVTANIITEVFQWRRDTKSPLPTTMTQLYTSYTCKLLTQHFFSGEAHSQQSQKIRTLEELPPDMQQQLQTISRVAWEGILKQQLTFSGHAVKESLGLMLTTGELYSEEDSQVSRHFIHLTLQEFLAAYHMHISQLKQEEQQETIEHYTHINHLKVVVKFYFGLSEDDHVLSIITKYLAKRGDVSPYQWMFETSCRNNKPKLIRDIMKSVESVSVHSTYNWSLLDYYGVGYCVSNSSSKWELKFSYSSMGDDEMEMFHQGIMNNTKYVSTPHLVLLDISHNSFSEKRMAKLIETLRKSKITLKKLKLTGNTIGEDGVKALREFLRAKKDIEELNIDGSMISIMADHIETFPFKTLNMNYTAVSIDSCTSLATMLRHSDCQLQELHISHCKIDSYGAREIAEGLVQNHSVEEVFMFGNENIGDIGAGSIADMLKENSTIVKLDLHNCGITSEGCVQLEKEVRKNTTLRELDLSSNRLGLEGAKALSKIIQHNNLEELKLHNDGHSLEKKGVDLMMESLAQRDAGLKRLTITLSQEYERPTDTGGQVIWKSKE